MRNNNVFLAGASGVGKSYIIDSVIQQLKIPTGGFSTFGSKEYIYLAPYGARGIPEGSDEPTLRHPSRVIPVGKRQLDGTGVDAIPGSFESVGRKILLESANCRLVIMDELGFLEHDATLFQKAVLDLLMSTVPVLGVVKRTKDPFLHMVRRMSTVIPVSHGNRDHVRYMVYDWARSASWMLLYPKI